MTDIVTIHSLNQRFLEKDSDIPEKSEQILYYSLAIGHHVGVIDCFKQVLECTQEEYQKWIEHLPEGEARRKMSGLFKFGEIVIDSSHINLLGDAFVALKDELDTPYKDWTMLMLQLLKAMVREPAMYLMVRKKRADSSSV